MEGRWTVFLEGPHAIAVTESPALYQPHGHTAVPAVPCDDAAIERAIKAYDRTDVHALTDRQVVTLILRAAGETP